jgi:hypothetical protein
MTYAPCSKNYAVNDVSTLARFNPTYDEVCGYGSDKRRNATLRTSMSLVDDSYPDVVFLVPKKTANIWRITRGDCHMSGDVYASVYMKKDKRDGGGMGSTWVMELEPGAKLKLKPQRGVKTWEVHVCVEHVRMSSKGRQADIILKMLDE